ncbi:iron-sulfur cluster-binding protein [Maridesulfovibrio ferrireducens]|uniref:iron-sulfur cluster-binding protein n=1 Tax=Maridesulfovibrio ferrireducens TaxID=246191 RepID=UPI001A339C95|nr:iron-sulfur cluster-binding protein [Maridesulfovibrio ferrireducens]MBI9109841.1 iron-sulfur cluster-binding protein [Maridesulfovibrio ferrireducens]
MSNIIFARLFKITVFFIALTGAAQMPVFKRYYISDIPGLGWLADFYLTNKIHYALGAVLIFMVMYLATEYILSKRNTLQLSRCGVVRASLFAAVIFTGVFRVIKNLPYVTMDPLTVMMIDWTHLSFAILLGITALTALIRGRSSYFEEGRVERKL